MSSFTSSQVTRRAQCVRASCTRALALGPSSLSVYCRQKRGIRFGSLLSNYLEPGSDGVTSRRRRCLCHKNTGTLSRRELWAKSSAVGGSDVDHGRMLERSNRKAADADGGRSASGTTGNVGFGRNMVEHFLFGDRNMKSDQLHECWTSPLKNLSNSLRAGAVKGASSDFLSGKRGVPDVDSAYYMDSIPKRDVPLSSATSSTPRSVTGSLVESPETARSRFAPYNAPQAPEQHAPIFFDGPPPLAELKLYDQVNIDPQPWNPLSTPSVGDETGKPDPESRESLQDHVSGLLADESDAILQRLSWKQSSVVWQSTDLASSVASSKSAARPAQGPEEVNTAKATPVPKVSAIERRETYADLDKYGPVMAHEPDGEYKGMGESGATRELDQYDAVRSHEPDGIYAAKHVATGYGAEELAKFQACRSHEPDGKYAASYIQPSLDRLELDKYSKPFRSHEPDGKYAARYAEKIPDRELEHYSKAFRSHEPDGRYAAGASTTTTTTETQAELDKYKNAFRSHEPDGIYVSIEKNRRFESAELGQYHAFRSHEPNGLYADQAVPDSAPDALAPAGLESYGYEADRSLDASSDPSAVKSSEGVCDATELGKYDAVRWNEPDGRPAEQQVGSEPVTQHPTHYRQMLKSLMPRNERRSRRLTGVYMQDFPEEFCRSWVSNTSSAALLPRELVTECSQTASAPATSTSDRSRTAKQGGALSGAARLQAEMNPYSKTPQGLETSYADECAGQSTWPTFVKIYSQVKEAKAEEAVSTEPKSSLYKILAYNPTMRSIEMVETTSVVADSSNPLSPAEVLVRLSNPLKFFPYFAPLQAEGYEMVSGSGDVLVFRKARAAAATYQDTGAKNTTVSNHDAKPSVNAMDKTGCNRHPVDVCSQEPVFGGRKPEPEKDPRKASKDKGLPKRLANF